MQPTLLVLAAGMGSRYGGLKQIDPIGPGGETLLDYSVFDARRAGFGRVVFVIRREFETVFRERIGARYAGLLEVDYVFQSLDALPAGMTPPPGREKPWGTGHATWCARDAVKEPFAVINADDFYGRDSFVQLAAFLGKAGPDDAAMVGFRLANTLSEAGAVSRGVCAVDTDGHLRSVVENTGIRAEDVGPGRKLENDTIVSMNCWGFHPAFLSRLDRAFQSFLAGLSAPVPTDLLKAEFYLPAAVSSQISRGGLRVRVLPTAAQWFGVTYREDKPRVEQAIATLIADGQYPPALWA